MNQFSEYGHQWFRTDGQYLSNNSGKKLYLKKVMLLVDAWAFEFKQNWNKNCYEYYHFSLLTYKTIYQSIRKQVK